MYLFGLPHAYALFLVGSLGISAEAASSNGLTTDRMLRAATKRSDLYRRSVRIAQKFDVEVAYSDKENAWNSHSTFASQIKASSQKPILNLEEIEHHLQDVNCGAGTIKLHFVDVVSARDARSACHSDKGGLVVTSHDTCNSEGERAVYHVNDVSFAEDGEALELSVTPSKWDDAFEKFDISFGSTDEDHLFRRHTDFAKIRQRRQATNIAIPTNTPNNVNTVTFNLSTNLINQTFTASSFVSGLASLAGVTVPNVPVEIGCKNCTTTGQLALSQGSFGINVSQIDNAFQSGNGSKPFSFSNLITGGFVELAATNVGAYIDLFARPKASGSYEIALLELPVLGFTIPGVGQAGAVFKPTIATDFTVSGGVEVNYGLEAQIPNDSKVRIEFTDLTKSNIVGFPGSTLKPHPVTVNVSNIDIVLGLAFKPSIPIGFQFESKVKAEATVSMNLPRFDAKLSTNAQANCGNKTSNLPAIGPLMLVSANVSLTVDVGLDLALPLLPSPLNDFSTGAAIFSTSLQLVKTCISPQDAFKTLTGMVAGPTSSTFFAHATTITSIASSNRGAVSEGQLQKPTQPASSTSCMTTTTVWVQPSMTAPPVIVTSQPRINVSTSSVRLSSASNTPAMVSTAASPPGAQAPQFQLTGVGSQLWFIGMSVVLGALIL